MNIKMWSLYKLGENYSCKSIINITTALSPYFEKAVPSYAISTTTLVYTHIRSKMQNLGKWVARISRDEQITVEFILVRQYL